jgi:pyruvate kinase
MKKLTKIVATISDMNCSEEFIRALYQNGMNAVRINTAHQSPEQSEVIIDRVHNVSEQIAIIVDTKGPEIRTRNVLEPVKLEQGQKIFLRYGDINQKSDPTCIYVDYPRFVEEIPLYTRILIDDGYIEISVQDKEGDALVCEVLNKGVLKARKSVNVPGATFTLPSLTPKDVEYLEFAARKGVDFIAHSFVRNKQDVLDVQQLLDSHKSNAKIIAKIENAEGVHNLDEILDVAFGIMIARGDLGIEIPGEDVPIIQKEIIKKCILRGKPVITATQMMESMIQNPRPTRAEISDVANAILDGTDALMLSGETAQGIYPVETVATMARIAARVEKELEHTSTYPAQIRSRDLQSYIAQAAVKAANELKTKAIVVPTLTGNTVRRVVSFRSHIPVYSACYSRRSLRELAISYGVYAYPIEIQERSQVLQRSFGYLLQKEVLKDADMVVVIFSAPGSPQGETNLMEITTAGNFAKG